MKAQRIRSQEAKKSYHVCNLPPSYYDFPLRNKRYYLLTTCTHY